jgi:hypothetical protein
MKKGVNRGRGGTAAGQAPRIAPYAPPRFAVDDPAGYAFLEEHGYAVFKDVVAPDQVRLTPPPIVF